MNKEQHLKSMYINATESIVRKRNILRDIPGRDVDGGITNALASEIRIQCIADYCLNKNKSSLVRGIQESARLIYSLFNRYDNHEPIDASYILVLRFQILFDLLAINDITFAKDFAVRMSGRENERQANHPFSYTFGKTLQALVLGDHSSLQEWIPQLKRLCQQYINFSGYPEMIKSILLADVAGANSALDQILQGHQEEVAQDGEFFAVDKYICMWGMGLRKFAQYRGLLLSSALLIF